MKKENSIALILYQTLGYLWHLIVYIVLVPSLLVLMGQGLDYLLFKYLLSFDLAIKLDPTVATVLELSAFALIAFGVLIILEASLTLYKEAKAFPFSNITNKHLQPSKLATSGWYARVRHPAQPHPPTIHARIPDTPAAHRLHRCTRKNTWGRQATRS